MSGAVALDQVHRLSLEEYEQLVDGGYLEGQRVEFIDGLVLDMSPKSAEHENAIQWLMAWLFRRIDHDRSEVRVAAPLRLDRSEPEPDVMVCSVDRDRTRHPSGAELIIEVAHTSHVRDLEIKPRLYAQATADYWVVDLVRCEVVCHREPTASGFSSVSRVAASESLAPATLDIGAIALIELFAEASA